VAEVEDLRSQIQNLQRKYDMDVNRLNNRRPEVPVQDNSRVDQLQREILTLQEKLNKKK
jgi:polyhydroxyalkanoate synthesis regulator phasin